jgi:hypothetical protein
VTVRITVGSMMLFQMQRSRKVAVVALVRDYISDEERRSGSPTARGANTTTLPRTQGVNRADIAAARVRRAS